MASVPHLSVVAPAHPRRTVTDLLALCEQDLLPQKAPTTAYQLKGLYRRIHAELGTIPLDDRTPLVLRRWREHLATIYKPGMVRRYLETLSGPLTYAWQDLGWIQSNPMRAIKKPQSPPGRVRWLDDAEKQLIEATLKLTKGNLSRTARMLGVSRPTILRKLDRYGIKRRGE